jgi:hypothetical protein
MIGVVALLLGGRTKYIGVLPDPGLATSKISIPRATPIVSIFGRRAAEQMSSHTVAVDPHSTNGHQDIRRRLGRY